MKTFKVKKKVTPAQQIVRENFAKSVSTAQRDPGGRILPKFGFKKGGYIGKWNGGTPKVREFTPPKDAQLGVRKRKPESGNTTFQTPEGEWVNVKLPANTKERIGFQLFLDKFRPKEYKVWQPLNTDEYVAPTKDTGGTAADAGKTDTDAINLPPLPKRPKDKGSRYLEDDEPPEGTFIDQDQNYYAPGHSPLPKPSWILPPGPQYPVPMPNAPGGSGGFNQQKVDEIAERILKENPNLLLPTIGEGFQSPSAGEINTGTERDYIQRFADFLDNPVESMGGPKGSGLDYLPEAMLAYLTGRYGGGLAKKILKRMVGSGNFGNALSKTVGQMRNITGKTKLPTTPPGSRGAGKIPIPGFTQ